MADPEAGEEKDTLPASPDFSANAVPRAGAVIEGEAEDMTPAEPHPVQTEERLESAVAEKPAEEKPVLETPDLEKPGPEESGDAAVIPGDPPQEPSHRATIFLPALIALMIGGAAGFGGAYVLHLFDGTGAEVQSLSTEISRLESQQATLQQAQEASASLTSVQAHLADRLTNLETAVHADATAAADLRMQVHRLAAAKSAGAGTASPDLGPLTQQVGALQGKLAALAAKVDSLSAGLAAQQSQTRAAADRATQAASAHADNAAIAIIAGSLLRKAAAGQPFAAEVTALANHDIDHAALATLQATAATGVATPAALARQFAASADALLAAAPEPRPQGFFSRLWADAKHLVRIRKVGDTSGDGLAAQITRIENALGSGAVAPAYQQWLKLPEAAKTKSQAFGSAARQRLDTLAAAQAIEAEALAGLGKTKS